MEILEQPSAHDKLFTFNSLETEEIVAITHQERGFLFLNCRKIDFFVICDLLKSVFSDFSKN